MYKLWPPETAKVQVLELQARVVGYEDALREERQSWDILWKTAMGAWDFEHVQNPGSGYSEIGESPERARAIAAGVKHIDDLTRWYGYRRRLRKGIPAKPPWSHEHRDMTMWWTHWGAEWWRDVYSRDEQPSREEVYWWLLMWAKVQARKWKIWWHEVGQYEGVMGNIYNEIYLDSDKRPDIWSHGCVGEATFRDLQTQEMELRYRTVGTAAKCRWWSWWIEEMEDCFLCLFACFRSGGIE